MALMTVSIEPWAVWTITGRILDVLHAGENRHAIKIGHDEIENDGGEFLVRPQLVEGEGSAFDGHRIETEAPDHFGQKATLYRIVIDDQHASRHEYFPFGWGGRGAVPF